MAAPSRNTPLLTFMVPVKPLLLPDSVNTLVPFWATAPIPESATFTVVLTGWLKDKVPLVATFTVP